MAYQNIPTKVLTGEVRISYANLITPRAAQPGADPKYSVTLLIPKSDAATLKDIELSMNAAYEDGVSKKWGGAHPQKKILLHDGDGLRPSGLPFFTLTQISPSTPISQGFPSSSSSSMPKPGVGRPIEPGLGSIQGVVKMATDVSV